MGEDTQTNDPDAVRPAGPGRVQVPLPGPVQGRRAMGRTAQRLALSLPPPQPLSRPTACTFTSTVFSTRSSKKLGSSSPHST